MTLVQPQITSTPTPISAPAVNAPKPNDFEYPILRAFHERLDDRGFFDRFFTKSKDAAELNELIAKAQHDNAPVDAVYWVRMSENGKDKTIWRTLQDCLEHATPEQKDLCHEVLRAAGKRKVA